MSPVFECQDCIGMIQHGCYCAAMGACQPGGPCEAEEPYNGQAPCPHCFESSGYAERWNPHTWDDPGFSDADPTRPCPHCDGTGSVECEPITLQDLEDMAE